MIYIYIRNRIIWCTGFRSFINDDSVTACYRFVTTYLLDSIKAGLFFALTGLASWSDSGLCLGF